MGVQARAVQPQPMMQRGEHGDVGGREFAAEEILPAEEAFQLRVVLAQRGFGLHRFGAALFAQAESRCADSVR